MRGSISSSIAALAKLGTLNLSCNSSLSGELPLQLKDITTLTTVNICSTGITYPSDQSFTDWKATITFTEGTCSPACPVPVSQQSSPPPASQESSLPPPAEEGSGSGEGSDETENVPDTEVPSGEGDTGSGGCALVSGTQKPLGVAFSLLLAASALLAVSRAGRR